MPIFPDEEDGILPDHLKEPATPTDAEVWAAIEQDFVLLCDVVQATAFETREEAIGARTSEGWRDTAPSWHDDDLGLEVRAWQLIPYIDGIDHDALRRDWVVARKLIPSLQQSITDRSMTPQFIRDWGTFCVAAGAVDLVYGSEPSDVSHLRRAKSKSDGHDNSRQRWYAAYALRWYRCLGIRDAADAAFERLLNRLVFASEDDLSSRELAVKRKAGKEWLKSFMTSDTVDGICRGELKSTYRSHNISNSELEALAAQPTADLPDLHLPIPEL